MNRRRAQTAGAWLLLLSLVSFAPPPRPVTIFLVGDSTAAEKRADRRPETGWGEHFQSFFDTDEVRVVNLARNGRSTRTFIEEGRWEALLGEVRPGDYVFIQFGHNDQSETKPDRYTPPAAFRANLVRLVQDVREREAIPVLLTPLVRRRFNESGQFYDVHGVYPDLTRSVAAEMGIPLLDVHRSSEATLRLYGAEPSKALFLHLPPGTHPNYPSGLQDDTHFSPLGAEVMAGLVAEGVREASLGLEPLHLASAHPPPSAAVDAQYAGEDGALVDGLRRFRSIGAALNAAPPGSPYVVSVRNGRYYEKLTVSVPDVHLIGESREGTVITFDAHGDTPGPDGAPLGTWGSATLIVRAPGFRAERLTIENAFDYPANAALADSDPAKVRNPQAVALMLDTGSDRAVITDATVSGYQDTFFAEAGRAYVVRSQISGHVDFIFGAGQVVFEDCEILSRNRPGSNPTGYVTAPSTRVGWPFGFLFVDSRFVKEPSVPVGSVRLGRPWHPGNDPTANGSAVFIRTFMDDHIGEDGYAPISVRNTAGERIWYDLEPVSRFFEYGTYGPGTASGPRRPQLLPEQAAWYTPKAVLAGWNPSVLLPGLRARE